MNVSGQKGRSYDFAAQISNFMLKLKKRTSVRPAYQNTLQMNLSNAHTNVEDIVDQVMNLVLDYDAHCEELESQIAVRAK